MNEPFDQIWNYKLKLIDGELTKQNIKRQCLQSFDCKCLHIENRRSDEKEKKV